MRVRVDVVTTKRVVEWSFEYIQVRLQRPIVGNHVGNIYQRYSE